LIRSDTSAGPLPPALATRLADAERWVLLTGAGISADSGVPTFRDAQTGLWARYDAYSLATPAAFAENPALVWDWYQWRRGLIATAQPNAGHHAIAELARLKPSLALVTQNVDGLHQRAGSPDVIEFHGNINLNRCFDCGQVATDAENLRDRPPSCALCEGLLRPDVVWFGERIPQSALDAAFAAAKRAEIFIAVGTAALVYPAAALVEAAADVGSLIVEINTDRTPVSSLAHYVLDGMAASWLPAIAACVRQAVS
jgi:NAD-dependent deacetylase